MPDRSSDAGAPFDAYYFAHCCGRPYGRDEAWLAFFGRIADRIVRDIAPRTVLDAGCAWGLLVDALRARGVDAFGVDLSGYAIDHVSPAAKPYCRVGSIADPLERRYDLIVCIEVVEHMPGDAADAAIANLCTHADDVLFSSSPQDLREPTHVNVRPPEAWAEQFARHRFFRDPDFDASVIASWAVRFRKSTEPLPRLVRTLERRHLHAELAMQEARAFAMQTASELRASEGEIKQLQAALDDATRRIDGLMKERDGAHAARMEATIRLGAATQTIAHMERSLFWRVRGLWVGLNRIVGRPR